jgi:putative endonuclease
MYIPHSLGLQGEKIAAGYLTGKGYRILECNFRFGRNEIDIVATTGGVLCFTEVKTRASLEKGFPAEAVTPKKQKEIIKAAKYYLAKVKKPDISCRFDVVAILVRRFENGQITEYDLEHIPGAFMVE